MAAATSTIDSMIREYLLFRGYSLTLKTFETESKTDKNKQFKVQSIVDQFLAFIHSYDVVGLKNYWQYFDKLYFSRLGHDIHKLIKKLEIKLSRLYLIHALQNGKSDKVNEFFEKFATDIQHDEHWKDWFLIPFMKTPEQNKMFAIYFTKIWQDSVMLSLSNCLDTVFTNMKLPTLLNFEKEQEKLNQLCEENSKLKEQMAAYQKEISKLTNPNLTPKTSRKSIPVNAVDTGDVPEENKNRKKSPMTRQRFGWKILGNNKDNNKEKELKPISRNHNSSNNYSTQEQLLRNSMDENLLRKLMPSSQFENSDLTMDNISENSVTDNSDDIKESQSTFYASLGKSSFKKSFSFTGGGSNDFANSSGESLLEKPFIILSQDEFKEHTAPIVSTSFSDNGNMVASLDLDGYLKIWECYPSVLKTSRTHLKDNILCFEWIPNVDNKMLIGKSNSSMMLYDISQKKSLWESPVHPKYKNIISVRCNPNTSSAVCSVAAPLIINKKSSNFKEGSAQKMIKMKQYTSFNENSSTRQGALSVWDIHTGQQRSELSLDPFPVCVCCLSYNHNGSLVVTGGADGMIRLFDSHNCDCLVGWHAHTSSVLDVMFSADETSIYSLGTDGKLCVWDINKVSSKIAEFILHEGCAGLSYYKNMKELGSHNMDELPYIKLLASDSEGQYIMCCGPCGLMVYQASPKTVLEEAMHIVCPASEVVTLDWTSSPNCSTTVCGTKKGVVQISTLMKGS